MSGNPGTQGAREVFGEISVAAGTAIIGKAGIDQTTPGTTNRVTATLDAETSKVIGTVNLAAGQTLATLTSITNAVTVQKATVTEVVSTALEASHVLKASAGSLVLLMVTSTKSSAQWILVMDSATVPIDGAVTLLLPPIAIGPSETILLQFDKPVAASAGISVCNSSTGTFTKTVGAADCVFKAQVI